jgi:hypothetical protein
MKPTPFAPSRALEWIQISLERKMLEIFISIAATTVRGVMLIEGGVMPSDFEATPPLAARGHAAAAPPSSDMNSPRLISRVP